MNTVERFFKKHGANIVGVIFWVIFWGGLLYLTGLFFGINIYSKIWYIFRGVFTLMGIFPLQTLFVIAVLCTWKFWLLLGEITAKILEGIATFVANVINKLLE